MTEASKSNQRLYRNISWSVKLNIVSLSIHTSEFWHQISQIPKWNSTHDTNINNSQVEIVYQIWDSVNRWSQNKHGFNIIYQLADKDIIPQSNYS